ncbi:Uncharacterised protein r2_g2342 [Pycnogonum litorale]
MEDVIRRVKQNDPARGQWNVNGNEATIWVDASSVAIGVKIEVDGETIEDASWLRSEESTHINMAELDAVIKGVNMALQWNMSRLHLRTDSATVHRWISDVLTDKARLKTKAASEMLIRRRVCVFRELVDEYDLKVDIQLVSSKCNPADSLTRVPQKWLKGGGVCGAVLSLDNIKSIHSAVGHQGVKRTLYFVRQAGLNASKREVQQVIQRCQTCQSIDPAAVNWKKGRLDVENVWQRVGMDITHSGEKHYLTLIDCGPSRFAIWRLVQRHDSRNIIRQLESVFLERGAPSEILTDNDPAFTSRMFKEFSTKWGVRIRFRCAYVAAGNGIAERCHRTVKRIAARKQCSMEEAVYWYNMSPKNDTDSSSAPANQLYAYRVRIREIDGSSNDTPNTHRNPYEVGDRVWVRPRRSTCDRQYVIGTVTKLISEQAVEVDDVPRHVRHLRSAITPSDQSADESQVAVHLGSSDDDDAIPRPQVTVPLRAPSSSGQSEESRVDTSDSEPDEERPLPRRGSRERRPPVRYVPG